MVKNAYEILGVKKCTSLNKINIAYKKLLCNIHQEGGFHEEIMARRKKIVDAYRTIINMSTLNKTIKSYDNKFGKVNTYFGLKGYTIYKNSISPLVLQQIKDELVAVPNVSNTFGPIDKFELYRESESKIYVPKLYGTIKFGETVCKLPEPTKINMPFNGELRDYQNEIVDEYIKSIPDGNGGLLEIPCGRGKTVMGLKIASLIGLKTLVLVHKEFLANQWIERIQQFMPSAKVGRIQGNIFDVKNKDIVIGMVQTISKKDFPQGTFTQFGLTILDEVHHLAAKIFVRSLFQVVTKYMLGLSATMKRTDGLSYVFKYFIGNIIYKEEPVQNANVIIKRYTYKTDDCIYNKVEKDLKGQTAFSTMITKLCTYENRTKYILSIVYKTIKENMDQQMLILSHCKNISEYIYNDISKHGISVGYYIGGMKQEKLKESESKQIIVATYAMASEALDIKTLTTLLLATPKKDIVQSVGRILRSGGGAIKSGQSSNPLIIDILDTHPIFIRHANDRKRYYKTQGYIIEDIGDAPKENDVKCEVYEECLIKFE